MPPTGDVGRAVGPVPVPNRNIGDLEVQPGGAEEEVEIPKGVEVTEVGSVGGDPGVVGPPEHLGAAEGVLDVLSQKPAEKDAEYLVRAHVQELHRLFLHRVHEAGAVREFGAAGNDRLVEFGEFLGGHREVRVENHEEIALSDRESRPNGITLAAAGLAECAYPAFGMSGGDLLDLFPGIVA